MYSLSTTYSLPASYNRATKEQVNSILAFFEQDLTNCLYSYIDLKKYGISNPNLKIYYYEENGNIISTATFYYNGLQIYAKPSNFPIKATLALVGELEPTMIASTFDIINLLKDSFIGSYSLENGYVCGISKTNTINKNYEAAPANIEDLDEISSLICSDEGIGGHYNAFELKAQLQTRMEEGFGRNYIIRQNGQIVCHAATYAEVDKLAVISGVITHTAYRGKGLALLTVTALCDALLSEGKTPYLFYYTKEAKNLYTRIGFSSPSNWSKLSKIH